MKTGEGGLLTMNSDKNCLRKFCGNNDKYYYYSYCKTTIGKIEISHIYFWENSKEVKKIE